MNKPEEKISMSWLIIAGLASFCLLFLEILGFQYLTFLSNYLSANRVIAVALLGISLGALIAGFLRDRDWRASLSVGCISLVLGIVVSIATGCLFPNNLTLLELAFLIPFGAASLILSTLISVFPPHRIYAADLCGAGLGVLAAVLIIPTFREEGAFIFIFFIALLLAIALLRTLGFIKKKVQMTVYASLMVASIVFPLANSISNAFNIAHHTAAKDSSRKIFVLYDRFYMESKRSPLIVSKGSLIERVDVLRQRKSRYVTFYNGYPNDHITPRDYKEHVMDLRLPVGFVNNADVLVIGTAAEGITKAAKLASKWPLDDDKNGQLVGVEINPAIVKVMTGPLAKYSAYAYNGYEMHVMDARSFLARDKRKFDIITCLNTHRIHNIGDIGPPEYIHTYEGLKSILAHLTDRGMLILEEREITESAVLGVARFIITVREVLKEEFKVPYDETYKYIVVMQWRSPGNPKSSYTHYVHLFIKRTPFTTSELDYLENWRTGKVPIDRGRKQWASFVHMPDKGSDHLYAKAASALDISSAFDPKKYHMEPITDDKPFPYDVYRYRKQHVNLIKHVGILTATVALVPAIALIIVLRKKSQITKIKKFSVTAIYLTVLGFAYLLVEIVLMQKFQIFLNSPVYSVAIVLGTMLIASGIGSKFAERLQTRGTLICFIVLLAILGILSVALGNLLEALIFLPFGIRIVIAIVIVGLVAFFMGMPFPWGVSKIRAHSGDAAGAIGFGLNGAAGAIATPVALLTSTTIGFSKTYLLGAAAYLLCALFVPIISSFKEKQGD